MKLVKMANILWGVLFFCVFKVYPQYISVGDTISSGIIYKNIKDTTIGRAVNTQGSWKDSVDIDYDNDNIYDVRFLIGWEQWSHYKGAGYYLKSLNNIEFDTIAWNSGNQTGFLDSVAYNAILDNNYNWFSTNSYLYLRLYGWSVPNNSYSAGVFISNNKYLGFRKILSNDTIYGWFLIDVSQGYSVGEITIKSYAYKGLYSSVNEYVTNSKAFRLFPNPVNDKLFISNKENKFQDSEIKITNYLGQTIIKTLFTNSIDVSKLSQGIYTLRITTKENQNHYSKFVKE